MPKTKFQEVIFTIMMVFVMVYAMICYNIALNIGGMSNKVFLAAFHELVIMGPIAFVLDFFFVGTIAKKKALKIVNPEKENPFHLVLAISFISVAIYVSAYESGSKPILFKHDGKSVYCRLVTDMCILIFPMALWLADILCGTTCTFPVPPDLPGEAERGKYAESI